METNAKWVSLLKNSEANMNEEEKVNSDIQKIVASKNRVTINEELHPLISNTKLNNKAVEFEEKDDIFFTSFWGIRFHDNGKAESKFNLDYDNMIESIKKQVNNKDTYYIDSTSILNYINFIPAYNITDYPISEYKIKNSFSIEGRKYDSGDYQSMYLPEGANDREYFFSTLLDDILSIPTSLPTLAVGLYKPIFEAFEEDTNGFSFNPLAEYLGDIFLHPSNLGYLKNSVIKTPLNMPLNHNLEIKTDIYSKASAKSTAIYFWDLSSIIMSAPSFIPNITSNVEIVQYRDD